MRGRKTRFWIWDPICGKPTPWTESANNHLTNEALSASLKFVSWYAFFKFVFFLGGEIFIGVDLDPVDKMAPQGVELASGT